MPPRARKPKTDPNVHVVPVRLGQQLRNAHMQAKSWAEEFDRLKAKMQEAMGEAENLVDVEGVKLATWSHYKTSQFRQAALKAAHPEIAAEFTELVPRRTFKVEALPEGGDDE